MPKINKLREIMKKIRYSQIYQQMKIKISDQGVGENTSTKTENPRYLELAVGLSYQNWTIDVFLPKKYAFTSSMPESLLYRENKPPV